MKINKAYDAKRDEYVFTLEFTTPEESKEYRNLDPSKVKMTISKDTYDPWIQNYGEEGLKEVARSSILAFIKDFIKRFNIK